MVKYYRRWIWYRIKKKLSKADKVLRPIFEKLKIYVETIGFVVCTIATIFVACTANNLTEQQIEFERSPLFLCERIKSEDYVWDLMEYYTEPQLYYEQKSLQLDLFSDFNKEIFNDSALYNFLGIRLTPDIVEKLQLVSETTEGEYDDRFEDKYEYYNYGVLDDRKQMELFSESNYELIHYVLKEKFNDKLISFNNYYLIRNEGAPIVIYKIYPFVILEISSKQTGKDNLYFMINDYFDLYRERGENSSEFFIRSRSPYFAYEVIRYLEYFLRENFEDFEMYVDFHYCVGLEYGNIRKDLNTEWYTIEYEGLKKFNSSITKIFPNKNKEKLWDFGEYRYSIYDVFNGVIEDELFRKFK